MPNGRLPLETWDKLHNWHPFTPMASYLANEPLIITHASGFSLFDQHGREYIDGFSSLWCNVHGHRVPELDEAIFSQLQKVAHSTFLGLSNEPATILSKRLVDLAPSGLKRVFYSDSGATAVEVAIKMAFQYHQQKEHPQPQKTKFLSFTGAYHGDTMGDVSIGDLGRFHDMFKPIMFPTIKSPAPHCKRCHWNLQPANCGLACADFLEELIAKNASTLAAVVIEPLVQGAAGMITAPDGFLKKVREITKKHGVLLIADEVAVGFGRTGTLFACEQEEVIPDFLCLGKGITGGYLPLAATLTHEYIFEAFLNQPDGPDRTFQHGHTYTGNPLGAAVAIASLDLLTARDGVLEKIAGKVERLQTHLNKLKAFPEVFEIRAKGFMVGIEIKPASNQTDKDGETLAALICSEAIHQGLMIRPLSNVVVLIPPPAIPEELVDRIGLVIYNSFRKILGSECSQGNS